MARKAKIMESTGRYDNIPLSEKTKKGMTLTIDDLAAIGRLLTLQDNVYEEMFQEIKEAIEWIHVRIDSLEEIIEEDYQYHDMILEDHGNRIVALEEKFKSVEV